MGLILLASLIIAIVWLFAGAGILVWVTNLFKIERSSYKKSLVVLIVSGIISIIAGVVFAMINPGFLSSLMASITTFFVFHYFYKKYYQVSLKKSLGVYIVFGIIGIVISLAVVIPTRLFLVSPFIVSGETMSPTYNNGDYLLINKFNKDFSRGDVVIFRYEKQPDTFLIKRIIGLPSEKIEIQDGKILVNGQVLKETYYNGETTGNTSLTLGNNQYFVLGDNRNKGFDSRSFGPIAISSIEGKVFYTVSGMMN